MVKSHYDWSDANNLPFLQSHSLEKHEIFKNSFSNFLRKAASKRPETTLTIVDGFCGGGVYKSSENGVEIHGSPFIFLEKIGKIESIIRAKRGANFRINAMYYFVDRDANAIKTLKSQLYKMGYGKLIGDRIFLLRGSFSKNLPFLLKMLEQRNGHSFFLLDQYGYKDAPLPLIKQIFAKITNSQVMLTFAKDAMINYIANTDDFRKCVAYSNTGKTLLTDKEIGKTINLKNSKNYYKWRAELESKLLHRIVKISGAKTCDYYSVKSASSHRTFWLLNLFA